MRRSNLTIALYLALVFASGLAVGAYGYRLLAVTPIAVKAGRPSPEEWRRQYLKEMQTRLNLTPEQLQQMNAIMDATRARFREARAKHDQEVKAIHNEQVEKIRATLTPQQLLEYERLRAEREQRAKSAAEARR